MKVLCVCVCVCVFSLHPCLTLFHVLCLSSLLSATNALLYLCACVCRFNEDLELEDAIHTAILALKVRQAGGEG